MRCCIGFLASANRWDFDAGTSSGFLYSTCYFMLNKRARKGIKA